MIHRLLLTIGLLIAISSLQAAGDLDYLFSLSLQELTQVSILTPAAITRVSLSESPANVSVITAQDIKHTPARNIYDLLETYVPGAFWMNHEEGPHPGIRGNIVNRNYKYLLLVNGRNLNSKAQYGAKTELEQWNLDDIERIEVIRGPGSVTYGPGAVAGVINIMTHTASSFEGQTVSTRYINQYDSVGASYNYGEKTEDYSIFTHISTTRTKGDDAPQFLVTNNNEAGFVGKDILLTDEPLDYYADYSDEPQVKIHIDAEFAKNWRFWTRYTQQGATWRGNEVKSNFNGVLLNQQGTRDGQFTASLEHQNNINKDLSLQTIVSIDSYDTERRRDDIKNPDPNNVQNFKQNFSEDELFLRSLLNWQATDSAEFAFGAEFSRDRFGPGWGDDVQDMLLGEDSNIVSGPNASAIGINALDLVDAVFVGDGWYSSTFSLFAEGNLILSQKHRLILSARADKNTYSDTLFSPRIALILKVAQDQILKFIVQRSQRMNTASQLYIENLAGIMADEETLNSVEVAYSVALTDQHSIELTTFYNDAEVLAWDGDINASVPVGALETFGVEAELYYQWDGGSLGANYSFVKQLDWELSSALASSGISYSDYNQPLNNTTATMLGYGSDLNNWPNHAFKLYSRLILSNALMLHVDSRIFWGFKGAKDGLRSLANAVQGQPEEAAVQQALARVGSEDAYEKDFRLNSSLSYKPDDEFEVILYVQNLLGANDNKRYSYDSGNDRAAPRRVRYVEEPRTVGIRVDFKF